MGHFTPNYLISISTDNLSLRKPAVRLLIVIWVISHNTQRGFRVTAENRFSRRLFRQCFWLLQCFHQSSVCFWLLQCLLQSSVRQRNGSPLVTDLPSVLNDCPPLTILVTAENRFRRRLVRQWFNVSVRRQFASETGARLWRTFRRYWQTTHLWWQCVYTLAQLIFDSWFVIVMGRVAEHPTTKLGPLFIDKFKYIYIQRVEGHL